jgi:hypothetical protein
MSKAKKTGPGRMNAAVLDRSRVFEQLKTMGGQERFRASLVGYLEGVGVSMTYTDIAKRFGMQSAPEVMHAYLIDLVVEGKISGTSDFRFKPLNYRSR